jgi:hypothetical protein
VQVKLSPCGKATARFLDGEGKPLVGFQAFPEIVVTPGVSPFDPERLSKGALAGDVGIVANLDRHNYWNGPKTDKDGRCTLPALIPGATYRLRGTDSKGRPGGGKEFVPEAGKMKDVGEITVVIRR